MITIPEIAMINRYELNTSISQKDSSLNFAKIEIICSYCTAGAKLISLRIYELRIGTNVRMVEGANT